MEEILEKYYGLKNCNTINYDNGYVFFVDGKKYYLVKTNYDENMIEELEKMIYFLHKKNILIHSFIKNNANRYISNGYILMIINVFGNEITMYDIGRFSDITYDNGYYKDMNSFWYEKLDYLNKQRNDLSDNDLINNSFDYYLGVSELLLKNLGNNLGKTMITLSHKCLTNLSVIDFYNPFNIIYDVWLKDIGYYIKITNNYGLLDKYLDKLNRYELNYLFTRLCFPFEYFCEVSDILIDKAEEKGLLSLVTNVDKYERHLFNMENIFGIRLFEWIKK